MLNPVSHQRAIGKAALRVKHEDGRTRIDVLYQQGCAKLRLPRQHINNGQEAVFINSSGGLTGGDQIDLTLDVGHDAALTITTQACERAYRSAAGSARVDVRAQVASGGQLLWLPQETLLFDGANLKRNLTIDLQDDAELLMVEPLIIGRNASGEQVKKLHFHDRRYINRHGLALHSEIMLLQDRNALDAPFGLNENHAAASLLLVSKRCETLVDELRKILGPHGAVAFWAKGPLAGKLSARIVARDGYALRQICAPAIAHLAGRDVPKIWMS